MGAELNPAQRLHALGQSLWLDSTNRVMLRTGALARYVRDLAVTGLTSNPTILGHAMAAGSDYDSSLARVAGEGVTGAQDLVYALALEDLAAAASLFRPEWERTDGTDGYVSLEVPPDLAYDAAATVALARRLHQQAGFPNLLVKIPGTPQGLTAMEEAITAGIGVNVTLLFSDSHYLRTADAYVRALQRRRDAGLDLAVPSVASVFISRWDSAAGASWRARVGDGAEDLLLPSAAAVRQALAGTRRGWRQTAAGPVGIHLDQEPGPSRHLLPGPPSSPQHHRHRPGKNAARLRRSRNPGRAPRPGLRGGGTDDLRGSRRRDRRRCPCRALAAPGSGRVQRGLGRTAHRDRGESAQAQTLSRRTGLIGPLARVRPAVPVTARSRPVSQPAGERCGRGRVPWPGPRLGPAGRAEGPPPRGARPGPGAAGYEPASLSVTSARFHGHMRCSRCDLGVSHRRDRGCH